MGRNEFETDIIKQWLHGSISNQELQLAIPVLLQCYRKIASHPTCAAWQNILPLPLLEGSCNF